MRSASLILAALFVAACAPSNAEEHEAVEVPDRWMTDLEAATKKATKEGKPLFMVFRCDP